MRSTLGCTDWMVGPASRGNETIGCMRTEDFSRLNTVHYAASCLAVKWSYMRAPTPPLRIQFPPSIPLPPSILIHHLRMIQISWNFVTIFLFRFCPGHFHTHIPYYILSQYPLRTTPNPTNPNTSHMWYIHWRQRMCIYIYIYTALYKHVVGVLVIAYYQDVGRLSRDL